MEQAGRAAFPLFALVLGLGLRGDRGDERASRLVLALLPWAVLAHVVSLPLVVEGVRGDALNALVTLACGCALIAGYAGGTIAARVSMVGALLLSCFAEAGPVGALLVFSVWLGRAWLVWSLLGVLALTQYSVVPLVVPAMVWAAHRLHGQEVGRAPRMAFGAGYVAQFAAFSGALVWLAASSAGA